nr:GNAT family N-acetyltransferase [Kineosphaera limosa]
MAFANAPTYGHTRLSWVWTRPERRGRGFGGAITAAVSARAQGDGLRCLLIGDSRDQVSGTMFRKLGYQVADDSCHLHFDRA